MRKPQLSLLFTLLFLLVAQIGMAQNNDIIIDDQLQVLDSNSRSKLVSRLAKSGMNVHETVVYSKRCEYWYIVITNTGVKDRIQLRDCKEAILVAKDLESMVKTLGPIEKSIILASNINDLVEKANKKPTTPATTYAPDTVGGEVPEYFKRQINEHNTRYLFSPSAYNLRKAELYYNTVGFLGHDIQLGITDKFSLGMGTTIALNPLYVTPKVSFEIDELNHVSVGDLFIAGTWSDDLIINLAYVNYTRGTANNNFTVSTGLVTYEDRNEPLVHMAGMAQISRHLYFVTEHYYFGWDSEKNLYHPGTPGVPGTSQSEQVDVRENYVLGHLGVRYVNKEVDTKSWHFGIAYFLSFENSIDASKYPGFQNTERYVDFIPLPSVAFTYKIGKRM